MLLPNEVFEQVVPYAQLDRWERTHQLSIVREHIRELGEQIFDLSLQLQREFNAQDVTRALILVAELKNLRAYEERLTERA